MISDELVSLETAKLAKEKGFNWLCSSVKIETIEGSEREVYDEEECRYITVKDVVKTRIPTQARLQRWLREEKGLILIIRFDPSEQMYDWGVFLETQPIEFTASEEYFKKYELALEDALKFALEKLV